MRHDTNSPGRAFEFTNPARPAPLCYSRRPKARAIAASSNDSQGNIAMAILNVLLCSAAFLAAYYGWL